MPWLASRATNFIEKKEPAYTGPVAIYRLSTSDLNVSSLQCRDESSKDLKKKSLDYCAPYHIHHIWPSRKRLRESGQPIRRQR
ncbi:uncharacterized protein TNCV_4728721 [Trichonephila clavipes]|nr:uncharacterized protein TNCV_4728721 [Trichonephila clavipes]